MARSYTDQKELGPEDEMPIGKHKGRRIIDVLDSDADYLKWFAGEVDDFDLSEEVQDALEDEDCRNELCADYL